MGLSSKHSIFALAEAVGADDEEAIGGKTRHLKASVAVVLDRSHQRIRLVTRQHEFRVQNSVGRAAAQLVANEKRERLRIL